MTTTSPKQSSQWNFLNALRSRLGVKLLIAFVIVLIVPLVSMEVVLTKNNTSLLVDQATRQRINVCDVKARQLEKFFDDTTGQVRAFSNTSLVHDAMKTLSTAFATARNENNINNNELRSQRSSLRAYYDHAFARTYKDKNAQQEPPLDELISDWDEHTIHLQHLYVQDGAHSLNTNELLDRARDRSNYSKLHARFHPQIRHCQQKYDYGNILLCNPSGRVVYSVQKTLDFGTFLTNPERANSHLAEAFRTASQSTSADDVIFSDFANDTVRQEEVTGYALSPIVENGKTIGVVAFEIPIDRIQTIVHENSGYETSETYVVGPDMQFRTDPRFLKQLKVTSAILNPDVVVDTAAIRAAQDGQTSADVVDSYLGAKTVSAWQPLEIPVAGTSAPAQWTLVSEVGLDEVLAPSNSMTLMTKMATPVVLSLAAAILTVMLLVRPWLNQAEEITTTLGETSAGDKSARAEILTGDEFGSVAESVNKWLDTSNLTANLGFSLSELAAATPALGAISNDSTSEQLQLVILEIQNTALEVSRCAKQIQSATENLSSESSTQSSQIVDTSMALDEMVESIHHVADSTSKSASVAEEARQTATNGSQAVLNTIKGMDRIRSQVQSTSKRIKRLGESSQEIGEIVQLISDVADRTSILALNASVQAAMAGDAGHGFQVVAEEVDRLSKRCNDATKHIARLVKCIQTETSEAIIGMEESTVEVVEGSKLASQAGDSLADIDSVSNRLAELIDSISGAAKQQARSGILVSRSIKEVSSVMTTTSSGTKQTEQLVNQLAARVDELRSSIARLIPKAMQTPVHAPVFNEPASDAPLLGAATEASATTVNAESVS